MIKIKFPKHIPIKPQRTHDDWIKNNKKFKSFLYNLNLGHVYKSAQKYVVKKDMRISKIPHIPDLSDLYYIYNLITLNNRISVLEYGTGWSSLIIYKALQFNKKKNNNKFYTRCDNPYSLTIVDNVKKFMKISKKRLQNQSGKKANIYFHYSKCVMTTYKNKYSHHYINHPLKNPDFIFLDGPNNFTVSSKVNNFTVNSFAMPPMSCDILKYEHFLTPGTIILCDGRTPNVRFLLKNFERNWIHKRLKNSDLNILILNEQPFGIWNEEQLKFYNK